LMVNTIFFPSVDRTKFLDTSVRADLLRVENAEGRLLTAPTLGETLQAAGQRMLVVSSGSSGSAYLNNHTVAGGAILHYEFVLPESLKSEMSPLGPPPSESSLPSDRDRYAVDAFLKVGIPRVNPSVTVMWLGSLDDTAHANGVGAPQTVQALRLLDSQLQRVEDGLKAAGLFDSYNIWVTSDHGFSTHTGGIDLNALLKPFDSTLTDGSPRIVTSGGAIYVRDNDAKAIAGIVSALQRTRGVGAIFTAHESGPPDQGRVPGTLSFEVSRSGHARGPQILYSPDWTDAANQFGMPGAVTSNGVAGHGSSSPWDIHNTLMAAGPDLQRGIKSDVPTANVDLAPTVLKLLNLSAPPSMEGRVVSEAFVNGPRPDPHGTATVRAQTADGSYTVVATLSTVRTSTRQYRYLDKTDVIRR
jgi:hypothetical protein